LLSFDNIKISFDLYIIDNSSDTKLEELFIGKDNFYYLHSEYNKGFAKAHNQVLQKIKDNYEFHLIINPDVFFEEDVLSPIVEFLDQHDDVVQIIPKILNEDKSIQFTYKYEPRPFDLLARRFFPKKWFNTRMETLSQKSTLNGEVSEIPIMSGCFMFFRTRVLDEIGFLDERFFLYMEDIDFSKRISEKHKSVYFPDVSIFHKHTQGSYNDRSLMRKHMASAIKYYNKHGWYPLW
jgi:GT2 family glycosyltransferase